jgi:glycosyltransferase involved in cell wall biosynthesis
MLRICYCLSHYHPIASGAERQAHRQAQELIRRGHAVQVITRAVAGSPEIEELDGVTIQRLIRPVELGLGFGLTFVATLSTALTRLRDSFDVVHCHQGLWEAAATGIARPFSKKPSVVQPAAGGEFGEIHQWSRTRGRGLLRRAILRNSHFVAISAQIERELVDFGVAVDRLTRLASGVDTNLFSPGESPLETLLPPRPRVLFLGRLHAQKNLSTLLAAWAAARHRAAASLLIAGDGPLLTELKAQSLSAGTADSIHFVGAVNNPLDYLRAADIFVLPSFAEGMSNSLLEAMSVGLPSIASRIGGNTDLVTDCTTGLLVEPLDVYGWCRAISELLENSGKAKQLGSAARDVVTGRYSIRAIVDQYVSLYERLIAERPR